MGACMYVHLFIAQKPTMFAEHCHVKYKTTRIFLANAYLTGSKKHFLLILTKAFNT